MLEQLKDIVRRAGAIMLDASVAESDITAKEGHANFVTVYDVAVQRFLRKDAALFRKSAAAFCGRRCISPGRGRRACEKRLSDPRRPPGNRGLNHDELFHVNLGKCGKSTIFAPEMNCGDMKI